MKIDEICKVTGKYLAYDEEKKSYYLAVITIPRAKITYKGKEGIPVVDILPNGNNKLLYYIGLTEEE